MEPIEAVFNAIGKLTYAEMMELACYLRDTASAFDFDTTDGGDWANVLNSAREGRPERDA
ncbi:hypothetical protein [Synechococcus phage Yong-M3-232]|nr:hypothetical protein [Synechococcus phage Yong-M3-232]